MHKSLGRYATTGALATAVNVAAFWFLAEAVGLWYVAASAIAFSLRSSVRFVLLRGWVFAGGYRRPLFGFLSMEAGGLLLGTALIALLVEAFEMSRLPALVLVVSALYAAGFLVSRRIFGGVDS